MDEGLDSWNVELNSQATLVEELEYPTTMLRVGKNLKL